MTAEPDAPNPTQPPPDAPGGLPPRRRWSGRGVALVVVLLVFVVQWYFMSFGTWTEWSGFSSYYDQMCEGFRSGHLYLKTQPVPELTALPDPYDPAQNNPYRLHDAILFKDPGGTWRYYFYWGPAPAALMAVGKAVFRSDALIADQTLVAAFSGITVLFAAMLLVWVWERLVPETGLTLLALGVAMTGLMPTHLYFLTRPAIYEASIMGGQAFLVAGVYFAVIGAAGPRPKWWWLACAGATWGLAFGTRASLGLAIGVMCGLVALRVWAATGPLAWRRWWPAGVALALPLLLTIGAVMVYNYERFGRATEFGVRYQLAGVYVAKLLAEGYSSWEFVRPNLWLYLHAPTNVTDRFPWLMGNADMPWARSYFDLPRRYDFERIAGFAWSSPLVWFAVVTVGRILLPARDPNHRATVNAERWTCLLLLTGAGVGALPVLSLSASTMRYQMDFLPLLTLAAVFGIWQLARPFVRAERTYYTLAGVVAVLSVWTFVVAILFGFGGYSDGAYWKPAQADPVRQFLSGERTDSAAAAGNR
jgi:hypothetical protein